ncbi:MAG TPA: hydroxymethylbilane synthase [Methylomirabilota bacterium]|nr:hydroxymethylbilane synthase [Methylomirabilota bacterium]
MKLRLGTRGSRLALAQSGAVADAIRRLGAEVEVVSIKTSGDRLAQVALAEFGGKALFVKEIEEALLDQRVDLGVHSLKDLPALLPRGLCLAAYPGREDPRDALVTRGGGTLADLPPGARVGTSSLRRRVVLLSRRADLKIEPIRGNVETRLAKLEAGDFDALVMAQAGLNRLGLTPTHVTPLSVDEFIPAVGQGILALEVREADREALELLRALDHTQTRMEATAERSMLQRLGAGCHTPVAGHARLVGRTLSVSGLVASLDGSIVLRASVSGPGEAAADLGARLAEALLAKGAGPFLEAGTERQR